MRLSQAAAVIFLAATPAAAQQFGRGLRPAKDAAAAGARALEEIAAFESLSLSVANTEFLGVGAKSSKSPGGGASKSGKSAASPTASPTTSPTTVVQGDVAKLQQEVAALAKALEESKTHAQAANNALENKLSGEISDGDGFLAIEIFPVGFNTCPPGVAFTSIASDGDRLTTVSDCPGDSCEEEVDLPFTFNWLNVLDVTNVTVADDGNIFIRPNGFIDILSALLDPGNSPDGSGIFTKTNADGSFTISYEEVGFSDSGGPAVDEVNAQVNLFKDGRVNLCYEPGSIPGGEFPMSNLAIPGSEFYPNPLDGFNANGIWQNAPAHPDGCACFYPGTPTP